MAKSTEELEDEVEVEVEVEEKKKKKVKQEQEQEQQQLKQHEQWSPLQKLCHHHRDKHAFIPECAIRAHGASKCACALCFKRVFSQRFAEEG
ncbi:hypothetical protein M0804_000253 [Polistes exclamans]|nr:hypothetical protein M0804_000253 [Polistes exclamans]